MILSSNIWQLEESYNEYISNRGRSGGEWGVEGACGWESSSVEDRSILSSHCVAFLVYGHKKNQAEL